VSEHVNELANALSTFEQSLSEKYPELETEMASEMEQFRLLISSAVETVQNKFAGKTNYRKNHLELWNSARAGRVAVAAVLQSLTSTSCDYRAPLYCRCNSRFSSGLPMIQCDTCDEWFHTSCQGLTIPETRIDEVAHFSCKHCNLEEGPQLEFKDPPEKPEPEGEELCLECEKLKSSKRRKKRRKIICTHRDVGEVNNDARQEEVEEDVSMLFDYPRELSYRVGEELLVMYNSKYYEAVVRCVEGEDVQVHYKGWSKSFDEWISKDSGRFAPIGSAKPATRKGRGK
jgi:hypothetical protein